MKTGDRIIRAARWGGALEDGESAPIRPTRSRAVARKMCQMYAIFGKRARIVETVIMTGSVTR